MPALLASALAAVLLPAALARHAASAQAVSSAPDLPTPAAMPTSQRAFPYLWFRRDAEEALRFYASVFPDAQIGDEVRWSEGGPEPVGTLMSASIAFAGQRFLVLNGGPAPELNDSFSIFVRADTQPEIDELWAKLTEGGGSPGPCGWLKDRFGLSWQVVPSRLLEMLKDGDPSRVQRVGAVLMQMQKIDLARLEKAYAER
jgi:predicted 3-demethylubiquinone-9 3-methyltransferase (glyoxalase superfamily)